MFRQWVRSLGKGSLPYWKGASSEQLSHIVEELKHLKNYVFARTSLTEAWREKELLPGNYSLYTQQIAERNFAIAEAFPVTVRSLNALRLYEALAQYFPIKDYVGQKAKKYLWTAKNSLLGALLIEIKKKKFYGQFSLPGV